jgi:hypothetical protein
MGFTLTEKAQPNRVPNRNMPIPISGQLMRF